MAFNSSKTDANIKTYNYPKWYDKSFLPDNYIYISHLDEEYRFWRIPFTPESVSDSMGSTFSQSTALGRSAPIYTYSNSGPRTVAIDLDFRRDYMDDINWGVSNSKLLENEDYLDNLIHALQAIAVPRYNVTNSYVQPPIVALRLGNEIFIKGVVTSPIGLNYTLPILRNGKFSGVKLSLTITEIDPYDAETVFKNGSFRGMVASLNAGMGLASD